MKWGEITCLFAKFNGANIEVLLTHVSKRGPTEHIGAIFESKLLLYTEINRSILICSVQSGGQFLLAWIRGNDKFKTLTSLFGPKKLTLDTDIPRKTVFIATMTTKYRVHYWASRLHEIFWQAIRPFSELSWDSGTTTFCYYAWQTCVMGNIIVLYL